MPELTQDTVKMMLGCTVVIVLIVCCTVIAVTTAICESKEKDGDE
jgi:hypothetical protein